MNGKQLDKFSSAEDGYKMKYMQRGGGVTFLTHPVYIKFYLLPFFYSYLYSCFYCHL